MSLNTQSLQPVINFLWTVADDVLVNTYQKGKYKDVILPMVVIRRLDLLLEPTKDQVLKTFNEYKNKLQNLDSLLTNGKHGSGLAFYNTSRFTLKKLLDDPKNLRSNFENYLNGFSENVQDIIKQFKFRNEIETLDEADILYSLIEKFCSPKVELHPDKLPPLAMGYVYEDLVRRFNEENNEEAGEHFTPREIIDLMTHLVFLPVKDKIQQGTYLIYDPCVGSGGMLTIAKHFMLNPEGLIKSNSTVHLYGQESTPFIYATCKSDMLIKGEDPDKIVYGSTLSAYGFDKDLKFDFMLTNPPYGKTWAPDKKALGVGPKGAIIDKRFMLKGSYKEEAVTSRVNDGQLMFVLHMLSKMKDTELGSRIASVHNGSALFTGDAGQGESEIRKYIIENDLLEAIVALPNDMFYNTGIPTYIFLFSNRKAPERKGKVQLINATTEKFYSKMRKSLGKKRVEFLSEHIAEIEKMFLNFEENEYSKIFDNEDFGYAQITVNRPLKDENGNIVYEGKGGALSLSKGKPKPDPKLKDTENIPLKEDIQEFFEREVLPFAPDSWWDKKDTKIGYEINFAKYFYKHQPPRALAEIAKDIFAIEQETEGLLKEIIE
jgi:type I restriction enzyme M protein